jgi:hypothetical protein
MKRVKCAVKKRLAWLTSNVMAIQDTMWHTRRLESLNGSLHGLPYALCSKRLLFYQHHFCWFLIQISSTLVCEAQPLVWCGHRHIQTLCFRQLFNRCLRKIICVWVTQDVVVVFYKLNLDIVQYYKWKQTVAMSLILCCLYVWNMMRGISASIWSNLAA